MPASFVPCWVQVVSLRVKIQTAPVRLLSTLPLTAAVLPSPESATATAMPAKFTTPVAPVPTSLACWLQLVPLRMNTPRGAGIAAFIIPADDGGVAIRRKRDVMAEVGGPD